MAARKIIVIGSGFGGLGAAVRLQTKGYQVELIEARDKLGGRAYVYEQDGFKFHLNLQKRDREEAICILEGILARLKA